MSRVDWVKRLDDHLEKTGGRLAGITLRKPMRTKKDMQKAARGILKAIESHEMGQGKKVTNL